MTFGGYLKIFRRRWVVIVLSTLAAALAMWAVTPAQAATEERPVDYTATATILVAPYVQATPTNGATLAPDPRAAIQAVWMHIMREFYVRIEQDEDGMYVGEVPQLRACYTQGRTLGELLGKMREVMGLCLDERVVTVPVLVGQDVGRGLLRKILRDAELNVEERMHQL